jgi:phosphoribosylanthranilate isomerase
MDVTWGCGLGSELPRSPSYRPLVKVCGLTREDDVALACALGAWALGFVFAESPRRVDADQCRRLIVARDRACAGRASAERGSRSLAIGVFAGVPLAEVGETARRVGLDAVQLHHVDDWAPLVARPGGGGRSLGVPVLPVVSVEVSGYERASLAAEMTAAASLSPIVLLDARVGEQRGGTGRAFDWAVVAECGRAVTRGASTDGSANREPLVLVAGGIDPDNAARALGCPGVDGIDVSSGVEASPGVKDHRRLRALFAAVAAMPAPRQ